MTTQSDIGDTRLDLEELIAKGNIPSDSTKPDLGVSEDTNFRGSSNPEGILYGKDVQQTRLLDPSFKRRVLSSIDDRFSSSQVKLIQLANASYKAELGKYNTLFERPVDLEDAERPTIERNRVFGKGDVTLLE